METMLLDRATPIDALISFIGAERVTVSKEADKIVLTPATGVTVPEEYDIDPDDYDNDTDYINAIPGAAERLIKSMNAPLSEFKEVPEECFYV